MVQQLQDNIIKINARTNAVKSIQPVELRKEMLFFHHLISFLANQSHSNLT